MSRPDSPLNARADAVLTTLLDSLKLTSMKAWQAVSLCFLAAFLPGFLPLWGQTSSLSQPVLRRNLNVSDASAQFPDSGVQQTPQIEKAPVINLDPFRDSPLLAPPPPEALTPLEPKPANNRRNLNLPANFTDPSQDKDNDWLWKGVQEQQRKQAEAMQRDALTASSSNTLSNAYTPDNPFGTATATTPSTAKPTDNQKTDTKTTSLPFFSKYTTSGLDAMKSPLNTGVKDPLGLNRNDTLASQSGRMTSESNSNPLSAPSDAVKINSPIIDPLALAKTDLSVPSKSSNMPSNSRLSVDNWLSNYKEHEKESMMPQQAPTMADLYKQNQIPSKTAEVKVNTVSTPVVTRPNASSLKIILPSNRGIPDPNGF